MHKVIEKWDKMSMPAKSSIVFLIATVFIKGIVFITTPIFTRIMSENEMGIIGAYNSWRGIYEIFAILSITSAGIFNVGMSQFRENRDKYLSAITCMTIVIAIIIGTIVIIFNDFIINLLNIPKSLLVLMVLYTVIMPAQTFWVAKQRYEYKYRAAFLVIVITTVISQLNAIIAVCLSTNNLAEVRLWSTALIELPLGIFFIILLLKNGRVFFDKVIWKDTLFLALPLIPHYLSSVVLTASDRIMIYNLDCPDNAGIYTVVYGIGAIGSIIWSAIQGSLTPYIYDKLDSNSSEGINLLCKKMVIVFGVACIGISLLAPEAVMIMGPKSYYIGAYAVPAIVGAIYVSCLYNLFSLVEFYYKKTKFIAFASFVAAMSNVVLNFVLIPIFGFIIAGYTTLASYILLALMHYINMKRIEKFSIYDGKQLFIICFIILSICIATVLLYECRIARYIIGVLIIIGAIIKRKDIKTVFNKG